MIFLIVTIIKLQIVCFNLKPYWIYQLFYNCSKRIWILIKILHQNSAVYRKNKQLKLGLFYFTNTIVLPKMFKKKKKLLISL